MTSAKPSPKAILEIVPTAAAAWQKNKYQKGGSMFGDKLELKDQMGGTYLIQRLMKPLKAVNPYAFGGGFVNGGVSPSAMSVLSQAFSFDYMGAAEFEYGAVPAAIQFLAELTSDANEVFPRQNRLVTGEHKKVFYLCPKVYETGVINLIDKLLKGEREIRLKEYCGLADRINGTGGEYRKENVGWLELDNGFFFFTDKDMFAAVASMFGLKVNTKPDKAIDADTDGVVCEFCDVKSPTDIGLCPSCGSPLAKTQ